MEELRWSLPVAVSRRIRSCFVALPSRRAQEARGFTQSAEGALVALHLQWAEHSEDKAGGVDQQGAHVGWNGLERVPSDALYVNSSGEEVHSDSVGSTDDCLVISYELARALGIIGLHPGPRAVPTSTSTAFFGGWGSGGGGARLSVLCTVLPKAPAPAQRIEVQPCGVDDWEVRRDGANPRRAR